ncbi:MAG: 5-guanidino-2-oxopentanoate decarboxylase [Pseudomonadota bacterium]|nr:5-guanidino-2-oxopentanoate decarboxylase [Pseudomonadota bacterium]
MRFGEYMLTLLAGHGVRHVFGIPGVHTAELYRGFAASGIRHITPRHEQGAGFMADGYARITRRPGVCFVITGPGVTNIATAMAQAHADSIPMLVISSVNAMAELGHGRGNLHELPDQQALAKQVTAFSHTLLRPEDLPAALARAFAIFGSARPRPVHIEIPVDVMERSVDASAGLSRVSATAPSVPRSETLESAARLLESAASPVLLVGGGGCGAGARITALAERLDAPVVMTVNGRGLLPFGHPLAVPASPSLNAVRQLVEAADVALAIGTELGPTDYDMYATGGFSIPGKLIRIEIDAVQMARNRVPDLALLGDCGATLDALLGQLGPDAPDRQGSKRAAAARDTAFAELSPAMQRHVALLGDIRDALPNAVLVGDSTQAVYAGNLFFEAGSPSGWFNSATGYGTLGYALPAAIGAKLGAPEQPIVCLAGDGGLQFTLAELGSAMDAGAPIIVLLWNNRGYGEIKSYMLERGIEPEGVDLHTPDFCAIARAYGWRAEHLASYDQLAGLLRSAAARSDPTLIEIDETEVMG